MMPWTTMIMARPQAAKSKVHLPYLHHGLWICLWADRETVVDLKAVRRAQGRQVDPDVVL